MRFAAPGDDGTTGTAQEYEIRYGAGEPPTTLAQSWTPGTTPHTLPMRAWRALVVARAGR